MEAVDDDILEIENGQNLDNGLQGDSLENSSDSSGVMVSDSDSKTGNTNDSFSGIVSRGQAQEVNYDDEGNEDEDDDDDLEILEERGQKRDMSEDNNDEGEDDDIMEITEADPLGAEAEDRSDVADNSLNSLSEDTVVRRNIVITPVTKPSQPISITPSQAQPVSKQNTLVIVDTNSILSGRGPVPVQNNAMHATSKNSGGSNFQTIPAKSTQNFKIPDDAFLIEAPSFIVPYVFEQKGEATLKNTLMELEEAIKKEKGDDYEPPPERKKNENEDYFDSPVGRLLSSVGMNLVQEYVQADLLKMQKKKAEKEKLKSRGGFVPLQTQQSIISLKQNLEESKENNEPFRHRLKKCELCNFKTESELVMSTHLETPHMRNYSYRCNFCQYTTRYPHEIISHMEANHKVRPRLERAPAYHQCPNCPYEDNSKAKLSRHIQGCTKRFRIEKNLEPPQDWDTPAKLRISKNRLMSQGLLNQAYMFANQQQQQQRVSNFQNLPPKFVAGHAGQKVSLPPLLQAPRNKQMLQPGIIRTQPNMLGMAKQMGNPQLNRGLMQRGGHIVPGHGVPVSHNVHMVNNIPAHGGSLQMRQKSGTQPSISITPLPRQSSSPIVGQNKAQPQGKTSFVICEICDGYIKDLDQLRNHMQWIHKVKIHPKMIYNKPPLNCQKCQFRFFTDQGLERHLLGSHGLVTSSMQDAANKGQDNGRCPLCGKVYQWKLLAHVAKDHNVTLKPAHLSYKCTVCTATFGMYKLFESHVYSAHSMNSKKNERKPLPSNPIPTNRGNQIQVMPRQVPGNQQNSFRPLKINDEITIIPQPAANSFRNKGSLTITPHPARGRGNEDDGIQIIEIDDTPQRNGRKENGDMRGRLPISDSILRKRNLEISVCGVSDGMEDSFQQVPMKRLRQT